MTSPSEKIGVVMMPIQYFSRIFVRPFSFFKFEKISATIYSEMLKPMIAKVWRFAVTSPFRNSKRDIKNHDDDTKYKDGNNGIYSFSPIG